MFKRLLKVLSCAAVGCCAAMQGCDTETIRAGVREVMITNVGATFVDVTEVFVQSWVENAL